MHIKILPISRTVVSALSGGFSKNKENTAQNSTHLSMVMSRTVPDQLVFFRIRARVSSSMSQYPELSSKQMART